MMLLLMLPLLLLLRLLVLTFLAPAVPRPRRAGQVAVAGAALDPG